MALRSDFGHFAHKDGGNILFSSIKCFKIKSVNDSTSEGALSIIVTKPSLTSLDYKYLTETEKTL